MKVQIVGAVSDEVRSYEADEIAELPDDKAVRFIKAGLAIAVGGDGPDAAALADAPERADLPPAKKRGG